MRTILRSIVTLGFSVIIVLCGPDALAQAAYPSHAVRLYVGFQPGGTTDIIARLLAPALSASFGQSFFVDNRPGATGNIAAEMTARAPADGHTLIVVPAGFASNISVYANPGYDPQRDFAPISRIATVQNVLIVHPSVSAYSAREMFDLARRNPGSMNFGSPGYGSTAHLALEMLRMQAGGLNVRHIPYRGMYPAVHDLIGGHLHALMATLPSAIHHIHNQRVRPLAVASLKRADMLPQVATFHESGFPGFEAEGWTALLAPAGTARDIIVRLNLALAGIVNSPEFRARLARLGAQSVTDAPVEFAAYLRQEIDKWAALVKRSGVGID